MLPTLLAKRFQLQLHRESREASYLALVIGKKGSRLNAAKQDPDPLLKRNGLEQILPSHMSMPLLAIVLSRFLRKTVFDMTGLDGFYEVDLQWRYEDLSKPLADTDSGVSIFSAIQIQLGLRLDSRKGPLDVLVIDSALKTPVGN